MKLIEWKNLDKSFGSTEVLQDMSGGIEEGRSLSSPVCPAQVSLLCSISWDYWKLMTRE